MTFPKGWNTFFESQLKQPYFKDLISFLEKEYKDKNILPNKEKVFKPFYFFDPSETKVVILGQDPYYLKDIADGLCFSTETNFKPKSLINIFKELERSYGSIEKNYNLERWAKQKILLINTVFTVEENKPLSHQNRGWEIFTTNLISYLTKINHNIVYLLMGNNAIKFSYLMDEKFVVKTSHPSPLSFKKNFYGSNCFVKINDILSNLNLSKINW